MGSEQRTGVVLGFYEGAEENSVILTRAAEEFQKAKSASLSDLITKSGLADKKGSSRTFYGLDSEYSGVAVVSLGKKGVGVNEAEEIDEGRENIRSGVSAGVKQLSESGYTRIFVAPCGDAEAASEAAHLTVFSYDDLKTDEKKKVTYDLHCFTDYADDADNVNAAWTRGKTLADGQNLARLLMEAPANVMTPTEFARIAQKRFDGLKNVTVDVFEKDWAESRNMGAFLGVARGSDEPLKFVQVTYNGGPKDAPPLVVVGKGITFDSGGISIKPSAGMDLMRADMGGAACTLSSIYTAARLEIPLNIVALTPLCENMPGGRATKPGDVHKTMSGKTVQIDNTDAEGRLILCDALTYAETLKPRGIIDIATLTGAIMVALGASASGVFTNSNNFWEVMHKAGMKTGDRVWRMPLFKHYSKQVTKSQLADVNNIGTAGRMGGSCTAAAFLREFVTNEHWMHMDIAGVMSSDGDISYIKKGMSGRPTRTLVEFMNGLSKQDAAAPAGGVKQ